MGAAAQILTEEFYSHRTNFITFQIEKLKTALSLESTHPSNNNSRSRSNGQMFAACSSKDGKVVGFAEVDTCSLESNQCNELNECGIDGAEDGTGNTNDGSSTKRNGVPRPYMYNLAVNQQWKRKGIATELVKACEKFVLETNTEKRLYLRVRKCNNAAITFYESNGYAEIDPATINLTKEDVNSGSAEEGELILMAKDLAGVEDDQ
jgi:ribosomal protein S18 acetylase RimI-like enzyme